MAMAEKGRRFWIMGEYYAFVILLHSHSVLHTRHMGLVMGICIFIFFEAVGLKYI